MGMTLDFLMNKMRHCCEPAMTEDEHCKLERLLAQYATDKKAWMDKYLLLPSIEAARRSARQEVDDSLTTLRAAESSENAMKLITRLSLAYTFATTKATDVIEDTSLGRQFITPHLVQIMTICRCLALESSSSRGNLFIRMLNWVPGVAKETQKEHIRNHLVQILTGEGKSITLAIIAAYCVLRGIDVDIACYSEYLTRRDEKDMQPFFDLLDFQPGKVRYRTFEQLCSGALSGVGEMAKQVITTGRRHAQAHLVYSTRAAHVCSSSTRSTSSSTGTSSARRTMRAFCCAVRRFRRWCT